MTGFPFESLVLVPFSLLSLLQLEFRFSSLRHSSDLHTDFHDLSFLFLNLSSELQQNISF